MRALRHALQPTSHSQEILMNFEGKRIVVAGGTSGIGFAVAAAAAKEGAQVIVASRNAERVAAAVSTALQN
jgi:NAD(P)-dependent dehydrogenase (short-subunit alcohol dehydrogenase family)